MNIIVFNLSRFILSYYLVGTKRQDMIRWWNDARDAMEEALTC